MVAFSRLARRCLVVIVVVVVLVAGLSACALPFTDEPTVTIATILPMTGPDAVLGQAMQRAVDLAVREQAARTHGVRLTVNHLDEAQGQIDHAMAALVADPRVVGIVGPFSSQTAVPLLPLIAAQSLVTISPSATLPGLTQSGPAHLEGLAFTQLHPPGTPTAFFRLPETDDAAGQAAAEVAVAPLHAAGLAARAVFVVDDGSRSGKALAAAFSREFAARNGQLVGTRSLLLAPADNVQAVVTAIIEAHPDLVFYAGGTAPGATLRRTLTLTGAPQLMLLTAGPMADDPGWPAAVGVVPAAAASTTALLPVRDLAALPSMRSFVAAYRAAFAGSEPLPESALAYDAAMDQIAALQALLAAGAPVTRAALLARVAAAHYSGVTGLLAFDASGDRATPSGFSLYTCDLQGHWHNQADWPAGG